MDPTQQQYLADAKDIVDRLYADLHHLRARRAEGRQRRELASRIFRHVHTLKGSAGCFGLGAVSDISHEFEGVLDGVRLGRITIDDSLLNLFEETIDTIAHTLANSGDAATNTESLATRLRAIASAAPHTGISATNLRAVLPAEIAHALSEYDLQHAREAVREGAKLFVADAGFSIDAFDRDFRALTALLGESGEVIATVPGAVPTGQEINLRLLYAAGLISAEVRRRAEEIANFECTQIELDYEEMAAVITSAASAITPATVSSGTSVRVALKDLDELTTAVSDLLRDTTSALVELTPSATLGEVETGNTNLRGRFLQLEEKLIKLRLVPLSDLLNGAAARAGRMAAQQLQKAIEFEIIGGDVGIDKLLADTIAEPLMHLVRNAVIHGIETPAERAASGKPASGLVTLHGFGEGSRIFIIVRDDGRGIDVTRVAQSAVTQGIVRQAGELTADQAMRLIFRPGFSTSPETSELSGRGVGLEIVDRAMSQSGGEVRLTSEPGKGATFAMIFPATLARMRCIVVRSGAQSYCLDASVVADRLTLPAVASDEENLEWQGEQLSLLRLRDLLAQNGEALSGPREVLVCKPSEHRQALTAHQKPVGILVDEVAGEHETLVRTLGTHGSLWHGISGAAEMMDGNIALMIDLARLIESHES